MIVSDKELDEKFEVWWKRQNVKYESLRKNKEATKFNWKKRWRYENEKEQ